MSELCFEGWSEENGNKRGTCCCNCRYQMPIVAHPWNTSGFAKGPISEIIGCGCIAPDTDRIVFFDSKHGMCEMHEFRDNLVQFKRPE